MLLSSSRGRPRASDSSPRCASSRSSVRHVRPTARAIRRPGLCRRADPPSSRCSPPPRSRRSSRRDRPRLRGRRTTASRSRSTSAPRTASRRRSRARAPPTCSPARAAPGWTPSQKDPGVTDRAGLRDEPARHHHAARQPGGHRVDRRPRDAGRPARARRRGRAGRATTRARRSKNAGILTEAEANVVSNEEDNASVVAKIAAGEADAAIVYISDVSAAAGNDVTAVEIPEDVNVIATYPIAVVTGAPNADARRRRSSTYVTGADGQATLEEFGFGPRQPDAMHRRLPLPLVGPRGASARSSSRSRSSRCSSARRGASSATSLTRRRARRPRSASP